MDYFSIVSVLVIASIISFLLMPVAIRFANRIGAVDVPDQRKLHDRNIPVLGGLVIVISFLVSTQFFLLFDQSLHAFFIGLGVIAFTGLIDDLKHINHILKFTGEIVASLVFIIFNGHMITTFGDLLNIGPLDTGVFAIPISVFCMVGVMNALNFADGLDGLAGGISLVASIFLVYFAWLCYSYAFIIILIALIGSLCGFLYFNWTPARIFMGDTGSLVLGYILSAMCIMLVQPGCDVSVLPISMAIVMGLPIVDALVVMTVRMFNGKSPFLPDNTHLHHRIMRLGFNRQQTTLIIYALMFSCGLLAFAIRSLPEWIQFAIGVCYAGMIFGPLYLLNKFKYNFN